MHAVLVDITDPSTAEAEQLRMAHCAAAKAGQACRLCGLSWPCPTRLCLDEVSEAAQRRYAAQVHASWLAGTEVARTNPLGVDEGRDSKLDHGGQL